MTFYCKLKCTKRIHGQEDTRIHPLACQVKRRLMYSPFTHWTVSQQNPGTPVAGDTTWSLIPSPHSGISHNSREPHLHLTKEIKSLVKEERTNLDKQLFFHTAWIKIGKLQFINNLRFWGSLVSTWIPILSSHPHQMNKLAASSANTVPYGTNVPGKLGENAPIAYPHPPLLRTFGCRTWNQIFVSDNFQQLLNFQGSPDKVRFQHWFWINVDMINFITPKEASLLEFRFYVLNVSHNF